MSSDVRPPVPQCLAHRPTVGGLVIPWVNVQLADGGCDFRGIHNSKWVKAWTEGWCQTCGRQLNRAEPVIFLGGPNQIAEGGYFTEPLLHPECAAYAQQACPMVAGRQSHYAKHQHTASTARGAACYDPDCACGGWLPTPGLEDGTPYGEPAHEWFAVRAIGWSAAVAPDGHLIGGVPTRVLRTRRLTRPVIAIPVAGPPGN